MHHTAEIPGFTMSMTIESQDGKEIDRGTLAEGEFLEGLKVYAGMVVAKYGVTEADVRGWLISVGDQAKNLRDNEERI